MRTILKLLVSLKSAVALISLLTLLSMVGTFVPQNLEAVVYLQRYPVLGHWILGLGFDDMYRSAIFQACLWLLSLSTLVCILTRWHSTSRRLFKRLENVAVAEVNAMEAQRTFSAELAEDWQKHYGSFKTDDDGVLIGLRASGRLSLLGGMFIHIGLLSVLAGGLIGVFFSVEMSLHGRQGENVIVPPLAAMRAARDADRISREARSIRTFSAQDPRLEDMRAKVEALHKQYAMGMASPAFSIAFDELWIEHYQTPEGQPAGVKSWNSRVRFIADARETASAVIRVNHPVSFQDYSFYQASWNKFYSKVNLKVDLLEGIAGWQDFHSAASFPQTLELILNQPVKPEWASFTFVMQDFMPDFRVIDGRFISVSNELNNPAAMIVAYDTNEKVAGRAWAFPEDRAMLASHVSSLPFLFTFTSAKSEFESTLQMAYDPGKPVVWLGCLLFTLGMVMSFYVAYREDWVLVFPDGQVRIAIAGNRPAQVFARDLARVQQQLTHQSQENPQ
ncbi:MAG: cytochrome c biogenesis protein ResB [Candidatus Riflebacteria bacterium]|nr:cytochrome c biogenesis protein ResB [Candidatus Riflebacteria bacterium]